MTAVLETRWVDWQGDLVEAVADRWLFQAPEGVGLGDLVAVLPGVETAESTWRLRPLGNGTFTVTAAGADVAQVASWAAAVGAVQLMPDVVLRDSIAAVPSDLPDDPRFGSQWPMSNTGQNNGWRPGSDINVVEGWHYTTGSRESVVAVIDTGLDYRHPDLAANIWTNPGEIAGDGIDNDGNGYVDDVHGYDFFYDDGDPAEYLPAAGATAGFGHGTRSAGIIGAVGNNGIGVTGTAWEVSLMGLKVFSDDGSQTTISIIVEAINYATMMKQRGVNVVATNNSYGGRLPSTTPESPDNPYRTAIDAGGSAGILFVASSGNRTGTYDDWFLGIDNDVRPMYPASVASDYVISVAASSPWDGLMGFSTYGRRSVDLAAPGYWGWATYPTTDPGWFQAGIAPYSGTSMAAPHVAGAVALLSTAMPGATPLQIRTAILEAVRKNTTLDGQVASGGVLDVGAAMRLLASRLGLGIADLGTIAVPENRLTVITATATAASGRSLEWSIGGGADQGLFSIDPGTGALAFRAAADFETPRDADGDNRYEVVVRVRDGTATAVRPLIVSVGNVDETRPTVSFALVPSPRLTAADEIGVTFSKPVSGFGIAALELLRDDVVVGLDGATVTGGGAAYAVSNLASIAEAPGTYTLRFKAVDTGIQDVFGNPLLGNPETRWTVSSSTSGGVFITPASWTVPENTSVVGTLRVSGFPAGSMITFRIVGGADADKFVLDSTTGSLSFHAAQDYEIPGNTAGDNVYLVDIEAGFGVLATTQSLAVRLADADEIPPTITIQPLPKLRQAPLASINIAFSESVTGFDKAAIELLRDGYVVNLSSADLSGAGSLYTLGNLSALTATDGQYELRVVQEASPAAAIKDAASNPVVKGEPRWAGRPSPTAWVLAETAWVMRAGMSERPMILKDIDQHGQDARYYEKNITVADDHLFFAAHKERLGEELWVSDGTAEGTRLVADLRPGQEPNASWKSSLPRNLVARNGVVFFSAYIGDQEPGFTYSQSAVFRSDGTAAGTRQISAAFVAVQYIRAVPGGIVFSGWDGISSDLWFSDGVSDDSVRIDAIASPDDDFVVLGDTLVFKAEDGTGNRGLWQWNPQAESRPTLIAAGFDPDLLAVADDRVFFQSWAGWHETPDGTVSPYVRDANGESYRVTPGVGSVPENPGGRVFFDSELWVTDRTIGGTYLVKDIASGSNSSLPRSMTPLGDKVLFTADDGVHGRELWITDGTEDGTRMLLDILPGTGGSEPGNLTVREGFIYFTADDGVHGRELWRTDGTQEGTTLLVDINAGPGSSSPRSNQSANWQNLEPFIQHSGIMYFTALTVEAGWELWRSDGTPSGTWLVHDIWPGQLPNDAERSLGDGTLGPSNFRILHDTLFFDANDGIRRREVWRYELPTWTPKVSSPAFVDVPETATDVLRVTARYVGPASDVSFSIVGGVDAGLFTISPSTGVVSFKEPPRHGSPDDANADNVYEVVVRSSTTSVAADMAVTLRVVNVAGTPAEIALSAIMIAENAGADAVVGTLTTTDPDASNTFTYTLVTGTGSTDNAAFNISGNQLRATASLNFETKNSYSVRVRSTDQGGLFTEKPFTITVIDVNEAPTAVAFSPAASSLPDSTSTAERFKVADITVTDDGLGTNSLSLSGSDAGSFEIIGTELFLRAGVRLDGLSKPGYSVTVEASDTTLPSSLQSAQFTLNVVASGIEVADGQVVADTTVRSGDYRLIKRGLGTLILELANANSGGTVVEAGEVIVRNPLALGSGGVVVQAGAKLTLDTAGQQVSINGLGLDTTSTLDLGTSSVLITDETYLDNAGIISLIARGVDKLTGIISSSIQPGSFREIGHQILPDGSLKVGYSAVGDANMDGSVNVQDLIAISTSGKYGSGLADAGWWQGDFNHDGVVNVTDLINLSTSGLYGTGSYMQLVSSGSGAFVATSSTPTLAANTLPDDLQSGATAGTGQSEPEGMAKTPLTTASMGAPSVIKLAWTAIATEQESKPSAPKKSWLWGAIGQ